MVDLPKILIVEDDPEWLDIYEMELEDNDYTIYKAQTVEEASKAIIREPYDVVVTDLRLIGDSLGGLNILKFIKRERLDVYVIIFTAYGSSEDAQQAIRNGAYDYLTKPLDYEHARVTIKRAILFRQQRIEGIFKKQRKIEEKLPFRERFLYSSDSMRQVVNEAAKQADRDDNVLIIGPRGTGKGLLAEAIHLGGQRNGFNPINCASFSEATLEQNLFGYRDQNNHWRPGYFQLTSGGTLVLDGVSSMSNRLQEVLLTILEKGSIADEQGIEKEINIRLITLDTLELLEYVSNGLFNAALYQKLSASVIQVPALRERKDEKHNDIILLAEYFITKYGAEPIPELEDDAQQALLAYPFPGNVRELQLIIRRAIVKSDGKLIASKDIPNHVLRYQSKVGLGSQLAITDKLLCPHGNFYCDQVDVITEAYGQSRHVYLRITPRSLSGLAEQAHQAVTSFGYMVQRHVSTEGKKVIHCKYCLPVQMSRYAIIDLVDGETDLIYEIGLLHTLGTPNLLIKYKDRILNDFLQSLPAIEYASAEDARRIIDKWLSNTTL